MVFIWYHQYSFLVVRQSMSTPEDTPSATNTVHSETVRVVLYLILVLCLLLYVYSNLHAPSGLPSWIVDNLLGIKCVLTGCLGGSLYCLRAVYLNRCVRNSWDPRWLPWYYLRPLTSAVCGLAAYLCLRAGLVVLDASQQDSAAGDYGYLVFALFAGINVDRFMAKMEDLGQSLFGIELSRTAKASKESKESKESSQDKTKTEE